MDRPDKTHQAKVTAWRSVLEGAPGHEPAVSQSGCSPVNCESREHGGQSLSHCVGVTSRAHTQVFGEGPEHSSSCLHNKHLTNGVILPAFHPPLY